MRSVRLLLFGSAACACVNMFSHFRIHFQLLRAPKRSAGRFEGIEGIESDSADAIVQRRAVLRLPFPLLAAEYRNLCLGLSSKAHGIIEFESTERMQCPLRSVNLFCFVAEHEFMNICAAE